MRHEVQKGRPPPGAERSARAPRADWVRTTLARCGPFEVLDAASLDALTRQCSAVRFARRSTLCEQDTPADCVYVVASGRVRGVRSAGDHRTLTVAYSLPGDMVSETVFADARSHKATATATEAVEAVRIPLRAIQSLLAEKPAFAQRMLALMAERRLQAERRVESLLSRSVESRVAEFLLDAAERAGLPDPRGVLISARYTHQEIADYVGSTRETVTLTLGELRRRDLVCFDHRRIIVTDRTGLTKLV
jgi:CRP-like cAMP-binding protein